MCMIALVGVGAAAVLIFSIIALVLAWREVGDRSLSQTLDHSAGTATVIALCGAILFGLLTHHDGILVFGIGVVATLLLGLASKIVGYLDRRADRRRRRLLGLAVPRRFLPPSCIAMSYGLIALIGCLPFVAVTQSVAAATTHDRAYLTMPLQAHGGWVFVGGMLFYAAVSGLFGLWLTHRQRRKIEAEHARIAELDRRVARNDPSVDPTYQEGDTS